MRARALAVSLLVLGALLPGVAPAAPAPFVGTVAHGRPIFWDGAAVPGAVVPPNQSPCDYGQCWSYRFQVAEAADLLRVAIDVPMRDDTFELSVEGPGGARGSATNINAYNEEARVRDVRPGTWRVEVSTTDATESAFRLRASIHEVREPSGTRVLLPNLQVIPPFEFGFVAPANPLNGSWPPDDANPPLAAGPVHPISCAADETAEDGARKCLRFSAGPTNAGAGPFVVHLLPDGKAYQRVYRADGDFHDRRAGTWEYHKTHAHNHYTDVLTYKLFSWQNGRMKQVGKGVKSGFCPADQAFADWRSFRQVPAFTSSGDCNSSMGLSVGWGDVYRWQRPGQYVEFGDNADGTYVVQAVADIHGWVLESDERDNVGYAVIRITGDEIEVLERGHGLGPQDPDRAVVRNWWERPPYAD